MSVEYDRSNSRAPAERNVECYLTEMVLEAAVDFFGRSALKCGVAKSPVIRGKSCHTALWGVSGKC